MAAVTIARRMGVSALSADDAGILLSFLLASSSEGIALVDAAGVIRVANERLAAEVGTSIEELVGRPAAEVLAGWPAAGSDACNGHYTLAAIQNGQGTLLVRHIKPPDALAGLAERQQVLLEQLLAAAPIGIAVLRGPEHRIEFANPRYHGIHGPLAAPLAGRRLAEVFPRVRQAAALADEVYRTGAAIQKREWRASIGPGGRETYWDLDLVPLPGPDGRTEGVLMLIEEATGGVLARRQAQELAEQLATGQALLKTIIDNAPAGIVVADEEARVLLANAVAIQLCGCAIPLGQELPASDGPQFFHPDGTPCAPGDMPLTQAALTGEAVSDVELAVAGPNGRRRDLLMDAAPIHDAAGRLTGAVALLRDISASKQAQAEREMLLAEVRRLLQAEHQARQQAEAAVAARDNFLAAAAHELKTPITNLRGFAQLTLRRLDRGLAPQAAEIRQALLTMDRQADRLAHLVAQLLDISAVDAGQLTLRREEVDLAILARRVAERAAEHQHRHTIALSAPASVIVQVDGPRLEQVLYSLIDNAARFSPEGTAIEVEVAEPTPEAVHLTVTDHGPGVPPERRHLIFNRFYQAQTGRPYAGLGLGLYFCRRIVELHGGRVEAEFPADGGTRIAITLPRAPAADSGARQAP